MKSDRSKKILVVASWGDSLINFRGIFINELIRRCHIVCTCAPDISKASEEKLRRLGARFFRIEMTRAGVNPIMDMMTLWSLYRLIRRIKPDIVLAYTAKPVIYGSIASRLAGGANIYSIITGLGSIFIHQNATSLLIKRIIQLLYRIALQYNKTIFFQNPDDHSEFCRHRIISDRHQIKLINGSGVDLDFYQEQAMPGNISFLLAARLIKDKGISTYVAAAQMIKAKYPCTKCYLAGWIDDTPSAIDKAQLVQWVSDGPVEYLGHLSDLRQALGFSSVFVLPSLREGTPRSVLEAMSTGRPIITTDVPGCRETVKDGANGFLVPPQNAGALAAAMEQFIRHPRLLAPMGKTSRLMAESKYDVHSVNREILGAMNLI